MCSVSGMAMHEYEWGGYKKALPSVSLPSSYSPRFTFTLHHHHFHYHFPPSPPPHTPTMMFTQLAVLLPLISLAAAAPYGYEAEKGKYEADKDHKEWADKEWADKHYEDKEWSDDKKDDDWKKHLSFPFDFTSTAIAWAGPEKIINNSQVSVPGLDGAYGTFAFGLNGPQDVICWVSLKRLVLTILFFFLFSFSLFTWLIPIEHHRVHDWQLFLAGTNSHAYSPSSRRCRRSSSIRLPQPPSYR